MTCTRNATKSKSVGCLLLKHNTRMMEGTNNDIMMTCANENIAMFMHKECNIKK
jgi:hypothetical protein